MTDAKNLEDGNMLYSIIKHEHDDVEFVGLFEGPDYETPLDIHNLRDKFFANFDYRTLGDYEYPNYIGPGSKFTPARGMMISGTIDSYYVLAGGQVVDPIQESEEFKTHQKVCDEIRRQYFSKREDKIEKFQKKYPGNGLHEMFISYLKVEFGLEQIDCRFGVI